MDDSWPRRNRTDRLVRRLVVVLLTFPNVLLAPAFGVALEQGVTIVLAEVSIAGSQPAQGFGLAGYYRLSTTDVIAATPAGCATRRILLMRFLLISIGPIFGFGALREGWTILSAAAMGFLGVGAQPPCHEWGATPNEGHGCLRVGPWMPAAPGLDLAHTVLAIDALGDAVRSALDLRNRGCRRRREKSRWEVVVGLRPAKTLALMGTVCHKSPPWDPSAATGSTGVPSRVSARRFIG